MEIESLPPYFYHDIEDDETGEVETYRFFLSINRDAYGKWSCGYVKYADEDTGEMAIPQLVTNSSDSIKEAAVRMAAKVARYKKIGDS